MRRGWGGCPAAILLLLAAGCAAPPAAKNPQYLARAEEQFLREQYVQAARHYELFIAENPEDPRRAELETRVGKCYMGAGRADLAIKAFDQALADKPEVRFRWEILFRRAVAYRTQGDFSRAVEGFRTVVGAPLAERGSILENDEIHYEYAIALFRVGDWRTGQEALAKVAPRGSFGARVQARLGLTSFAVQIGSFADEGRARYQAEQLKANIRPILGDKPTFIVMIGNFARYEEAQREADRLRGVGYPDAFVLP